MPVMKREDEVDEADLMPMTPTGVRPKYGAPATSVAQGEKRRTVFLTKLSVHGRVFQALEEAEISEAQYRAWRRRHPGFKAKVEQLKAQHSTRKDPLAKTLAGGFAEFRKTYFGMDSPDFHLEIVDALENSPPGSVTLILLPPEHGKTTIIEDFCSYKLALDPNFRITVGSQGQNHAKKILGRVRERMEPDGPAQKYVLDFGPFAPDAKRKKQPWADERFTVWKKSSDQRDYSMQALGIGSNIQGTRADLMIIDDVQGTTNLNATVDILTKLRQDWLSRSGSFGRAVVIGTRVGPNDVYENLEESNVVNRVIKYAAYSGPMEDWTEPQGHNPKEDPREIPWHLADRFLWKDRYSPLNYLVMRVNAGEEPWLRNYMQRGDAGGTQPFKPDMLAAAARPEFSVQHNRHQQFPGEIVVAIDPGFGVNATMAALMTQKFLLPIHWRLDYDLTNNQQIWQVLEDTIQRVRDPQHRVTEVVIEDKAFQKGLLDDEGLIALRDRYQFTPHGHQTGQNKYDPDLGIPQMPRSFERSEILLPGAPDAETEEMRKILDEHMIKWRPYKRGNRLTQDLVITLWFCWMTWRRVRDLMGDERGGYAGWETTGLPYAPTSSGLLLPTGGYGRG